MRGFLWRAAVAALMACNGSSSTDSPIAGPDGGVDATTDSGAPAPPPVAPPPDDGGTTPTKSWTVLSAKTGMPRGIALDAANVYWTNHDAGSILRCAKTGCGGEPTVIAQSPAPWRLAVDAANVYWTSRDGGGVFQCPLAGCATPIVLGSGFDFPEGITVDDSFVYWTVAGPGVGGASLDAGTFVGVMRCAIGGCGGAPTPLATVRGVHDVVVDATAIYFNTDATTNDYYDGGVFTCPKAGCTGAPTKLGFGLFRPLGMALDATRVYWANDQAGVFACAKTGCPAGPTQIAAARPITLAIDGANAYWQTGDFMSAVMKCPLGGCGESPTTLASDADLATAINRSEITLSANVVVDETSVYVGNDDGTILRMTPK